MAVEETSVPWPTPTNQEPQVDYLENKFTSWSRVQAGRRQEAEAWNHRTDFMLQQLLNQQQYHQQMQKVQQMQQQQIQQIQQQMQQWSAQPH